MPRPSTAVAEVRDRIRDRITSGAIAPDARLVERTLAEDLGVSRVPVREALRQLAVEGFVAERPTGGMVLRRYSAAEIDELVEVNAALEEILVRAWASDSDPAALKALIGALAGTDRALQDSDEAAAIRANADFHAALVDHGPAGTARELLASIGPRLRWLQQQHSDPSAIHAEHRALVAAIEAGRPDDAAALIRQHARTSRTAAHGVVG